MYEQVMEVRGQCMNGYAIIMHVYMHEVLLTNEEHMRMNVIRQTRVT